MGGVSAPDTIAVCGSETVTFTATNGNSWRFYIDGQPVGARSTNFELATNTLIDGQVVTVESFTTTSTGGCSSMSPGITVSVGVNPDVFLTSTAYASSPSSSTFCEGESITFTASSTSAIATYTFMVGGSSVKESNSNTYTTGTPLSSSVSVSVRVQTAAGCIATDTLDLFYNDIDVKGTIGQISSTLCPNEIPPAFTNVASATATLGTISYRWQTRTSGTNFENTIPLVTTEVYTPTTGLTTTTFFRRVAESTYGGKLCEEYSNIIQIAVSESPVSQLQVGGVSAPDTIAVCGSETVTFTATNGNSWRFYIDGQPVGARSTNFELATNTLIDGQVVTVESFTTTSTGGCSSMSPGITVSVGANPDVFLTSTAYASSPSSSTFCEGESITFTASSTSAIATYTFMVGSSAVSVTTNNFYTTVPPLSSTTSVSVRVETAVGCTASQTLEMFLNEITSSGNIGQASATICSGETPPAFTNVASATGVGTISYQWQSRTFGTDFINVPVSATTQVYTETSALVTTTFYRRAAISTFGGKQCEEYSNVIEVKVGTPPISTLQVQGTAISAPATLTLCAGEEVTFVATGGTERLFYLDNNPLGVKSGSSTLSTSTLITGNRIKGRNI